ncbi:C-C motif chemokine 24-like [Tachysurus fulvidraco]|uniref:C-C motif chemokine 24-like n=1 Tax=Tachysurus fulvidraco TaxID=1234273 RepID=UPI001FEDBB3E|nr:C-C motif chemokine 24-like [Tachysurus fulvidraco]
MWVKHHMNCIDLINSLNVTELVVGPDQCCTKFPRQPIPVKVITVYEETDPECLIPGVIFTLQNGRRVCADPGFKWVKSHMNKTDQRLFNSLNKPEVVVGPDQCCTKFLRQPIPVKVITAYNITELQCQIPGVIFTLQIGRDVCADPKDKWVKNNMNRIDQLLFNSLNKPEESLNPLSK